MIRLDKHGREVIIEALCSDDDCLLKATNFMHPIIQSGQHTNGPATVWIKACSVDGDWINTGMTSMHKVRKMWIANGIRAFRKTVTA